MKLQEIMQIDGSPPITEEYSQDFADTILNEQANGNWKEVDGDELLEQLDQMIVEAKLHEAQE
jgi:hypothetical protein